MLHSPRGPPRQLARRSPAAQAASISSLFAAPRKGFVRMSGLVIDAPAKLGAMRKEMSLSCHFGQKSRYMSACGSRGGKLRYYGVPGCGFDGRLCYLVTRIV